MTYIEIPEHDRPLCPNSGGQAMHESHRLHVRVLDAFYEAVDKNEDGEMPEPMERAYQAAAYTQVSNRMRLYHHSAVTMSGNRMISITAWWFRCDVCGLVLPASGKPR